MERLIECDICLYYYGDLRKPRVLQCGHSFCTQCLSLLMNNGLVFCSLCRATMYFPNANQISVNYTLDSLVPHIKNHLGIKCSLKQINKKNEAALLELRKKVVEKEVRAELEKEIEEKDKRFNEEKAKIDKKLKLKIKMENENKGKIKRLQASKVSLTGELNNLKTLIKKERAEVAKLKRENKKLQLQKKVGQREKNIQLQKNTRQRSNDKVHHYKTRSSISRGEINLVEETNQRDEANAGVERRGRYSTRSST